MRCGWTGLLLAGLGTCAGCAGPRMGGLPPVVVELYDAGLPSGTMEIEAGRNGRILKAETDIDVKRLPAAVLQAAEQEMPQGTLEGAELEIIGGERAYEVKKRFDGRDFELVFTPDGTLLLKEIELREEEAPHGIIRAAQAAIGGGHLSSIEKIQRGTDVVFHVKLKLRGASYKVVIGLDGNVRRKVREAKAEVEIPLK